MKITLENRKKVSQFGNILKHLKHFSQDIEIFINEDRLYAQGMDGSQAALFELVLKSDWFTSYDVEGDVVLGINCELIAKVLHCLNQNRFFQVHSKEIKNWQGIFCFTYEICFTKCANKL